jgi:hypothetical protein
MNFENLVMTFAVVAKYAKPTDYCSAEHDILYLPLMADTPITAEDEAELKRLGAHLDKSADCWAVFT